MTGNIDICNFLMEITPFNTYDLERACNIANQTGIRVGYMANAVLGYCKESGIKIEEADIVGIMYEYILDEASICFDDMTYVDLTTRFKVSTRFDHKDTKYNCEKLEDLNLFLNDRIGSLTYTKLVRNKFCRFVFHDLDLNY